MASLSCQEVGNGVSKYMGLILVRPLFTRGGETRTSRPFNTSKVCLDSIANWSRYPVSPHTGKNRFPSSP